MKHYFRILALTIAGVVLLSGSTFACTGVYVGKDASDQGTYIIARSEDQQQGVCNKQFLVEPRINNEEGRVLLDPYTRFELPLPAITYQYTSVPEYTPEGEIMFPGACTNEFGVSVTGTVTTSTCEAWKAADPFVEDGLGEAILPAAVAAVAATAREAVDVLLKYVDTYGAQSGSTVMINDQTEVWIVEIYSGHHYAAMKMPDDRVAVFGNQNMIGLVDPKSTPEEGYIYSDGLFALMDKLKLSVKEGSRYHVAKSVSNGERKDFSNMRNWSGMRYLAPSQAGTYNSGTFYPLFYKPDAKVSVLTVMDIYRDRYEDTPLDMTKPGQEDNYPIGIERSSQAHILQTFPDWPAESAAINWICLGNTEHNVFIPHFSGITDTAEAYKVIGDTYDPTGAYWMFKRINTLAAQNRTLYRQGVKDFWKQQEQLMYDEMLAAASVMQKKYAQSSNAGDVYVTHLGIEIAEREMLYSDNLYAKLLTNIMHNTGLASDKTPIPFLSDVPLQPVAESKGYKVTRNAKDNSVTMTKGAVSYTVTLESDVCAVAGGKDINLTHYVYKKDDVVYIPMDFAESL